MPFPRLNNCCLEVAIQHALKKYFPGIDVQFNQGEKAQNDFQIEFDGIANLSPGEDKVTDALSKEKLPNLKDFFSQLKKDSIYISRRGQNLGAGHFTFLQYDNGCWWENNGNTTLQVTDVNGNIIIDPFWENNYKISDDRVGMGNHQYSLRLYELSLPRLFLGMNFVALFRQSAEDRDMNQAMVAGNIEEQLKQSDAVFLGLIPEATNYWQISPEIKLLPEQSNRMKFDYYCHELIKKNNPTNLDKLLSLPDLDRDRILHQLLRDAITYNSPATAKALLKELAEYAEEEKYLDSLQEEKEFFHWICLKRVFQLRRMQDALAKGNPPTAEMLLDACALNSEEAITYFFDQRNAHDVLKEQGFAQALIDTLLKTKAEFEKRGYTMKDAIFIIVEKILENCDADVSRAVIQQLQKAGLKEKEAQKLDEIIQAFKVTEEHGSSAGSPAPEDGFAKCLETIREQYEGFILTVQFAEDHLTPDQIKRTYHARLDAVVHETLEKYPGRKDDVIEFIMSCDQKALADKTIRPEVKAFLNPPKTINASMLNDILNQYRPNSWTGWILYILSWGTHESKTIQALRQHIKDNPGSETFTIDELKNAIAEDANTDSKKSHRIGLFEGKEAFDESGTDLVIQNILNQRNP